MIVRQNKFTDKEFEVLLTMYQISLDLVAKRDMLGGIPGGTELVEKALKNVDKIFGELSKYDS